MHEFKSGAHACIDWWACGRGAAFALAHFFGGGLVEENMAKYGKAILSRHYEKTNEPIFYDFFEKSVKREIDHLTHF